jgi:hypothetical protein
MWKQAKPIKTITTAADHHQSITANSVRAPGARGLLTHTLQARWTRGARPSDPLSAGAVDPPSHPPRDLRSIRGCAPPAPLPLAA